MCQVHRLNLQIAEDRQYFDDWQWFLVGIHLEDVVQARDVLLEIELHSQWLEPHILNPPYVLVLGGPRNTLKRSDLQHEVIHLFHGPVEHELSGILYRQSSEMG